MILTDDPQVPDHLRNLLGAAARQELEFATDGVWPEDSEEADAMETRVTQAIRARDNWKADCLTREEVAKLAHIAVGMRAPGRWPRTVGETYDVARDLVLTRDLLILRDTLGGMPTPEELAEPE